MSDMINDSSSTLSAKQLVLCVFCCNTPLCGDHLYRPDGCRVCGGKGWVGGIIGERILKLDPTVSVRETT